jgi:hypothetical protein
MSTKKKETPPPSDPGTGMPAAIPPATGKGSRGPRKAKVEGPTNRVVTDVAGDETLVLNCTTEESAIVAVTGKYTTRLIGISDSVRMAMKPGARVIDLADPIPATEAE